MKMHYKFAIWIAALLALVLALASLVIHGPHVDYSAIAASALSGSLLTLLVLRFTMYPRLQQLRSIANRHLVEERRGVEPSLICCDELDNLITSFRDMSEQVEQRESELIESYEFSTTIFNSINDAVMVLDPHEHTIQTVNPAFLRIHKLSLSETIGKVCREVIQCRSLDGESDFRRCLGGQAISTGEPCRGERREVANGNEIFCDVCSSPVLNRHGEVTHLIRVARNITEAKVQEQKIHHLAYHDHLTGLPNRMLFEDRLRQAVLHHRREGSTGLLAFVDLDRFKDVNDSHGHAIGDEVLKATARRLSACVRASDTVARMGGDEFIVLLHSVPDRNRAVVLGQQLLECIREPVVIDGVKIEISASIGLCFFPLPQQDVDNLLVYADRAMYAVKERGRDGVYLA